MSGIYFDDSRPDNSVNLSDIRREGCGDTYQSLLPSNSHSQLIAAPVSAVTDTTESYVHAHDSCRSHHLTQLSQQPCHNGRRRSHSKRFSRFASINRSQDLKHLYLKVKIGFLVICTVNVFVIVFCILTNPKLKIITGDDNEDFLYMGEAQPKAFKLCTKCQPLEAKVGTADGLIQQIRSSEYPKFCCFRRVDQLLRLVDWYTKTYVKQETDIVKESYAVKNDMIHLARQPVFAHLYFKDTKGIPKSKDKDANLTWETTGISLQRSHIGVADENSVLVIEETGYYYVYSHLVFRRKGAEHEYRHTISLIGLKDNGIAKDANTKSVLQGVHKLEKNNRLSVTASYDLLVRKGRLNYFGIFKL